MYWQRIQTEILARFGVITIDYPPANAMSYQTIKELDEAVRSFLKMDKVKTFIITGAGKYFVAGADISELQALTPITAGEFNELTMRMLSSIANSPKPVICAINGMALGGGLELALACDIRLAAEGAKLGFPEINLGVMPGAGGTQRLPRIVGIGRAKELIFTGRLITAAEALELGIVEHVVPSKSLMEETTKLAGIIAEKGAVALRAAKRAIMEGIEMPLTQALELEQELFSELLGTEDKAEGTAAFLERRPPRFMDR
jgi:enoyl-CoA hydratase/carnithine racemase